MDIQSVMRAINDLQHKWGDRIKRFIQSHRKAVNQDLNQSSPAQSPHPTKSSHCCHISSVGKASIPPVEKVQPLRHLNQNHSKSKTSDNFLDNLQVTIK